MCVYVRNARQVSWALPALGKLKQVDGELEVNLSSIGKKKSKRKEEREKRRKRKQNET
jgi:hypothetical protein